MRFLVLLVLLVVCPAVPASAQEWRWPLDGAPSVARPFVAPAHRYAAGHRGADLPAAPGAAVRAAADGLVSYAGLVAGRGVVVVVHGDLRTTYEPVSAVVGVGDLVAAGEVVALLEAGHAGCPALACLHWGLRRGEDYLDPVRLVAPGPVRLLPLDGPALGPVAGLAAGPAAVSAPTALRAAAGAAGPALRSAEGAAPDAVAEEAPGRGGAEAEVRAAVRRPPDPVLAATAAASLLGAAVATVARRRRG